MLCRRCANVVRKRGMFIQAVPPSAVPRVPGWEHVFCARCGAVLPAENLTERLLEKLSQLAQFGLVGAGAPLLKASDSAAKVD